MDHVKLPDVSDGVYNLCKDQHVTSSEKIVC